MGGIDASIYSQIRPVQMPDVGDAMQKGMTLSQLGMQNQQMQLQMQTQQAMRDAYAKNMGPNGQLDQQGFLNDVGRVNPQAAMEYQQSFAKMGKDVAESDSAKADAAHKVLGVAAPVMNKLAGMAPQEREAAFAPAMQYLASQGVPIHNVPSSYDDGWFHQTLNTVNGLKEHLDNNLTQANTSKSFADADKTRSETIKQNPGLAGQMNDPAKLVPRMVPKEHQAKALGEIDAAENTRRMAKAIMDSYDQADKDISGVAGTAKSLVKDPRSVYALHQAMQPTFKDLEGTVRQAAMDNTFKNITPSYGDSAQDRATKRQALQDYLQSKLSAPTARAYGIDLTQFDSTAPYKSAPNQQGQGGGGLINSANAAPPAALTAREHSAAVDWANKNSSDPRAKKILQINGVK